MVHRGGVMAAAAARARVLVLVSHGPCTFESCCGWRARLARGVASGPPTAAGAPASLRACSASEFASTSTPQFVPLPAAQFCVLEGLRSGERATPKRNSNAR
ncbi:hypothetical protein FB451DRAFT_1288957 [Mycena latifolia]|nr:hypothetical protein FB451DRAFT_1288957 [Mycena latifolia]